ncbi:MAG: hypothetical protein JWN45_1181 [Acidobacteriaceae bacterium]|nr:hypothetical protein [Acidobacteriaceae bacterium]
MKPTYQSWLERQKYASSTVTMQVHRAQRVENCHGDLDQHYDQDRLASLIGILRYSTDDERRGKPNPSKIPFDGDIRKNLASYRFAAERYREFRDSSAIADSGDGGISLVERSTANSEIDVVDQRIGLERDMQAALRREIHQLEDGLVIIDDGAERSVESGFIDITAKDVAGTLTVIELKAGSAGQRAVAQILSYMGDLATEDEAMVRGILVASDFDHKAKAAAKMVPNLRLVRYRVQFNFSDGSA